MALSLLAVVVLCCGGLTGIDLIFGDDPSTATENTAAEQTEAPKFVAPVTTTTPVPAAATTGPAPSLAPTARKAVAPTSSSPKPQPKPTVTKKASPKPKATTRKPTPKPTKTTKAPTRTVTPGAFCSPEGATGVSKKAKAYRCTRETGEKQARWRPI